MEGMTNSAVVLADHASYAAAVEEAAQAALPVRRVTPSRPGYGDMRTAHK